jgi:general secretion pathway protein C
MKLQTLQPGEMVQLMQGRPMQLAIVVINLLLVVWIAWMLARLTLDLLDTQEPDIEVEPVEVPAVSARQREYRTLVKQMPGWHLMGEAKVETAAPKPAAPVDAPETRLKLTLRGAFASDEPAYARAIIADQRGQEEMYAVGDKLPGNAELSEIQTSRVILMRGGRYETLSLPEEALQSGSGRAPLRSGSPAQSQRLQTLRNTLKKNPKSLYGLVRTTPRRDEEGKMIGYTLQPGRNPKLFDELGLQPGDVVTRLNDIELSDLSNGMRALKSAQAGETVTLTVLRGDQEEELSINVPE